MSIRSTSLEPKSQLTINLALKRKQKKKKKRREKEKRRKFPIKRIRTKQKGKIPNQGKWGKAKRKRILDQRSEEKRRNMQKGLRTRQYLNNTDLSPSKQEKKGNHDLKWSSPFDCQPKSCVSATFLPRTKQKQKRKRPKTFKAKIPTKNTIPKKKSY